MSCRSLSALRDRTSAEPAEHCAACVDMAKSMSTACAHAKRAGKPGSDAEVLVIVSLLGRKSIQIDLLEYMHVIVVFD